MRFARGAKVLTLRLGAKRAITVLVSAAAVLASASAAFACSCMETGPPCQAFWKAEAVFDATVEGMDPTSRQMNLGVGAFDQRPREDCPPQSPTGMERRRGGAARCVDGGRRRGLRLRLQARQAIPRVRVETPVRWPMVGLVVQRDEGIRRLRGLRRFPRLAGRAAEGRADLRVDQIDGANVWQRFSYAERPWRPGFACSATGRSARSRPPAGRSSSPDWREAHIA